MCVRVGIGFCSQLSSWRADSGLSLTLPVSSAKPCPSQALSTHGKAEWMEGDSSRALS